MCAVSFKRLLGCDGTTLKTRGNRRSRVGGSVHRTHFELRQVSPVAHPLFEECWVVTLHHLKTAPIVLCHPARNVAEALGRHASALTKAPVDGNGVPATKVLHNHVKHGLTTRGKSNQMRKTTLPRMCPWASRSC